MYAADNKGCLPPGQEKLTLPDGTTDITIWALEINPYVGGHGNTFGTAKYPLPRVLQDPGARMDGGSIHYSSNPLVLPDMDRAYSSGKYAPYKLSQVRPASEIVTIMTGAQIAGKGWDAEYVTFMVGGFMFGASPYRESKSATSLATPIKVDPLKTNYDPFSFTYPPGADARYRHLNNTAGNFLFADGHAATLKIGELTPGHLMASKNR